MKQKRLNSRGNKQGAALAAAIANGEGHHPGRCRKHGETVFYVYRSKKYSSGFKSRCYACHREGQWRRHGFSYTWAEYCALAQEQLGRCANPGCRSSADDLDVDHCHDHGHVRGLLCSRCNRAEGLLTPESARGLAEYMERFVTPR